MGFLKAGNPLSFDESKKHIKKVRASGLQQFLNHYNRCKKVQTPRFLWGDELEYGIFSKKGDCNGGFDNETESPSDRSESKDNATTSRDRSSSGMKTFFAEGEEQARVGEKSSTPCPGSKGQAAGDDSDNTKPKAVMYDLTLRGHEIRAYLAALEDKFTELHEADEKEREETAAVIRELRDSAAALAKVDSDCAKNARRCRSGSWTEHCSTHSEQTVFDDVVAKEGQLGCSWMPEYGAWMVEAVPAAPYNGYVQDLLLVEQSMQLRRQRLHMALNDDELAPSMSNFPMLGVEGYRCSFSGEENRGVFANSPYIRDTIINPHPRFGTLTQNIRTRRGCNVNVTAIRDVPVVPEDKFAENGQMTESLSEPPLRPATSAAHANKPPLSPNEVHMDAMAFGMGCCCLQVTMQSLDEEESRFLHDQLTPLSPYFLAISAATPIFKGVLVDTDTRWKYIGMSVDCRTDAERSVPGVEPKADSGLALDGVTPIPNSRYSGTSAYIAKPRNDEELQSLMKLNDLNAVVDEEVVNMLEEKGLDHILAMHVAHLFIRDPMVVFDDAIELDDENSTDHFENFQSTNWRTIRWKTPALEIGQEAKKRQEELDNKTKADYKSEMDGDDVEWFQNNLESFGPGWRVEFRPLELSLTDFENAAYAICIVLLSRAILKLGLNFYMPMSLVEENLTRSEKKDACLDGKFWVPKNALKNKTTGRKFPEELILPSADNDMIELNCHELFNGSTSHNFKGIIPVIKEYMSSIDTDDDVTAKIMPYLDLISKRASGELPTTAKWIRNFVTNHADYKGDGNLSVQINDDLCAMCDDIGMGVSHSSDLTDGKHIANLYCIPAKAAAPFETDNAGHINSMREKQSNKPCNGCKDLSNSGTPSKSGAYLTSGR